MSNFSPECLLDTIDYDAWSNTDVTSVINGLQQELKRRSKLKTAKHTILDGNGIGAVSATVTVEYNEKQRPDDCVTAVLKLNSSCFGYHDGPSSVGEIESHFDVTVDAGELEKLGSFLISNAAAMRSETGDAKSD